MAGKWNTLRNQILIFFVAAMAVVLLIVGVVTFNTVSKMLKTNAEKQIQQTAVQASGRMEALYQQIDMISTQVSTSLNVQQLLLDEKLGQQASFAERQSLMSVINSFQAYTDGIDSFELYLTDERRLFPLNEKTLTERIDSKWIRQAEQENGRLVWIGRDPAAEDFFLALKQVNLIDRWFSPGGYLLIRIRPGYFQFQESAFTDDFMALLDQNGEMVTSTYEGDIGTLVSDYPNRLFIDDTEYMMNLETSRVTGWQTFILMPVQAVTQDVSYLRMALVIAAGIGFAIFLAFSLGLSNMITRPIFKLTSAMRYGRLGALKASPGSFSTIEINELNDTYNQLVETMNHLMQEVYEKEIIRSRTELKALQAQINPHFLFNTLEALYWSLDEKGEEELAEYVFSMPELFRYTISHQKQDDWVELGEEMEHIERYMHIMKVRFGERLMWQMDVPSEYEPVQIPRLLIQPIVENAILHGVGNKNGQGTIKVNIKPVEESTRLRIEVIDDGPGMNESQLETIKDHLKLNQVPAGKRNGMAIVNVNKRLQLYYPKNQSSELIVESKAGEGTKVMFEVPIFGGDHHGENDSNRRG
ncbi:cache domain-containing sensor histidine kinase [Halalkalibacter akibai]|uniref:Two-component sensor histidine kinase n=1 Tax=Halalkalibacter akibai (strain ATCC 43226 / DSM 21942 / CIP 109018 / JCM 9157 / 1139) TaxID=1236973 RepID=W4QQR9_HALA3|nr:sensor histidine kinase [Halalkalibacter akibai]GAE33704.1 two-component sensor histidine kinase [Halalkalibacter akibai JCM 9157]